MSTCNSNDIIFTENGHIDIAQFHALHRMIGWDPQRQQTEAKTIEMLSLNHYHIAAQTDTGQLVGFARVCGDPYIAQVLDVITHPDFRQLGIATRCMIGVLSYLLRSDYVSVTLTDGSKLPDFYAKYGFQPLADGLPTRVWRRNTISVDVPDETDRKNTPSLVDLSGTPKTIGILGGISPASTTEYYNRILAKYYALKQDYYYPKIIIHSLDFQTFTDYENNGNRTAYINEIMSGIESLEAAGADFILMAANSPHSVYHDIARRTLLPVLSIVDETLRHIQLLGLQRLLLLGIKHTMQSDFYQMVGQEKNISILTPSETEQDTINRIIFDELVLNVFKLESKRTLLDIIHAYEIDGVILGCTELPLIISAADLEIPAIDTLDVHTEAALQFSLGRMTKNFP